MVSCISVSAVFGELVLSLFLLFFLILICFLSISLSLPHLPQYVCGLVSQVVAGLHETKRAEELA